MRDNRIALFYNYSNIETNPSLACLINSLSTHGYSIDVFMPGSEKLPSIDKKINRYPFPEKMRFTDIRNKKKLLKYKRYVLCKRAINQYFKKNKYCLVIGADNVGIIAASEWANRFNLPLVYISFEIFFMDELTSKNDLKIKKLECAASRKADFVIIQDEYRAKLMSHENSIPKEKFIYLPVSPSSSWYAQGDDYIRDKFNLSKDKKIVLHSGSFGVWTYAEELMKNVSNWPNEYVLIIHTPSKSDGNKYLNAAKGINNVRISTTPLDTEAYETLVRSADVGLVLYKPSTKSKYTQKNIQTIGLSSGKFAYYIKYGLPVISAHQSIYEKLSEKYKFGVNINCIEEIPTALEIIFDDAEAFRNGSQQLFLDKVDYNLFWPNIHKRIKQII